MKNLLKEKMLRKEPVLGTFSELGSGFAVECLGYTGLDFIIIDAEHGPFGHETAMELIKAAELSSITPLVRVPDSSRASVLKMLDIGAKGLIVPCINTVEEVQKLVEYTKYYPLGNRGFAPTRVSGYGNKDFAKNLDGYFATSNAQTLLLPQCETVSCLEKIEEIAALDGVDGIFVGPYDLSVALGKPAKFDDKEVIEAIVRALNAAKKANKFAFIYAGNVAGAKKHFAAGFDAVAYNMDTIVLIDAFKEAVKNIKG